MGPRPPRHQIGWSIRTARCAADVRRTRHSRKGNESLPWIKTLIGRLLSFAYMPVALPLVKALILLLAGGLHPVCVTWKGPCRRYWSLFHMLFLRGLMTGELSWGVSRLWCSPFINGTPRRSDAPHQLFSCWANYWRRLGGHVVMRSHKCRLSTCRLVSHRNQLLVRTGLTFIARLSDLTSTSTSARGLCYAAC